jgi:uncharacterized protein (TIGR00255 family)
MTIRSMTGFGRASLETPSWSLQVTIRTVNHRALDLVTRSRIELGEAEAMIRERAAAAFARGRVEINVEGRSLAAESGLARPDEARLRWAAERAAALVAAGLLPSAPSTGDLLRWPGVLETGGPAALADDPAARSALLEVVDAALRQVGESRRREGAALAAILGERIAALRVVSEQLRSRRDSAREEIRRAFDARIQELLGQVPADPVRVAQEVAFLLERGDIREELDRLDAHLAHFEELLGKEAPGKRLDFLTQEILRELNTTGSKAKDLELIRTVLDGKTICDQLREQVQNVE